MIKGDSTQLTDELIAYTLGRTSPADPAQRMLDDATHTPWPLFPGPRAAEERGRLLAFLARLTGARRIVEVGTLAGLPPLSRAQVLPPDGTLLSCAGPDTLETLRGLPQEPHLDLVVIGADGDDLVASWDELVPRTRQGGLLVVDAAAGELPEHAAADDRVDSVPLPATAGLTLARRR
ncbi:O-methyltransferase [Streptomyces sp. NPDC005202]|uniref:O-methyltransferase n=1 Tax=Streptomyces sp. NPDC005202 TaxID=3157021 RepID=UPI0033A2BAEE